MPKPKGTKAQRCAMQRGIFRNDPKYGKEWVEEFGDQCKGVTMKATKKARKKKVIHAR